MTLPDFDAMPFQQELKAIQAESSGWLPLAPRAYLHRGAQADTPQDQVIEVVGIADASMAGVNVLWLF